MWVLVCSKTKSCFTDEIYESGFWLLVLLCMMLVREDGFGKGRVGDSLEEIDGEDPVRKVVRKRRIISIFYFYF